METTDVVTIVLSLVAIIVTVIGFFASLRFYRDGVDLQNQAQGVLSTIEQRASAIQSQVGGLFDKTLDAALGRYTPHEAEAQQRAVIDRVSDEPETTVAQDTLERIGLAADTELARLTARYYALSQLRITDISDHDSRAVFNLGSPATFNLLDGPGRLLFLGFFVGVEDREVVARTRILLNNIALAHIRLASPEVDPAIQRRALEVFDSMRVDLIVSEDVNVDALVRKIAEYQSEVRNIEVTVRTAREIRAAVEAEMAEMTP